MGKAVIRTRQKDIAMNEVKSCGHVSLHLLVSETSLASGAQNLMHHNFADYCV